MKLNISKPTKSPLSANHGNHIEEQPKTTFEETYSVEPYTNKRIVLFWIKHELSFLTLGLLISLYSTLLHHAQSKQSFYNFVKLFRFSSIDDLKRLLQLFPAYSEDAGLSIILTLLSVCASLAIGVAVENRDKIRSLNFRSINKALGLCCDASSTFLGLCFPSFLNRYGLMIGGLSICSLVLIFSYLYGIAGISFNYYNIPNINKEIATLNTKLDDLNKHLKNQKTKYITYNYTYWNFSFDFLILLFGIIVDSLFFKFGMAFFSYESIISSLLMFIMHCALVYTVGIVLNYRINPHLHIRKVNKHITSLYCVVLTILSYVCISFAVSLPLESPLAVCVVFLICFLLYASIIIYLFHNYQHRLYFTDQNKKELQYYIDINTSIVNSFNDF